MITTLNGGSIERIFKEVHETMKGEAMERKGIEGKQVSSYL
jgi:hypothetical protein